MKITFLYLLIFASLFSCGQSKSKTQPKEKPNALSVTTMDTTFIAKSLERIVKSIASINEVQYEYVGIEGKRSSNYQNFLQLKKVATTDELVKLTNDTNNVVACYASWALADKSYSKLSDILIHFLKEDKSVQTLSGCIISDNNISGELYHRYWNRVSEKVKATDQLLLQLDSTILYSDNSDWLLMTRAFENRIYPPSYKKRIASLAFMHGNHEALFYLCNWYRADNYNNLKISLISYLKKTDFRKAGTADYYRTIDELLKFRDTKIEKLVIQKLKKDKNWKSQEQKFKSLLDDYGIYDNFD